MKVAILFTGLVRSYLKTYSNFVNNLLVPNRKNHDIDVYLAFWDHTHIRDNKGIHTGLEVRQLSESEIMKIIEMYEPERFRIMHDYHEKNAFFKEITPSLIDIIGISNHSAAFSLIQNGIIAQSYTWNAVFSLIEKDYDLIIKTRFDVDHPTMLDFNSGFDLEAFNCAGKPHQWPQYGMTDIFFGAAPIHMQKIMQEYHKSVMKKELPSDVTPVYPEMILKRLIKEQYKIDIKPIPSYNVDVIYK